MYLWKLVVAAAACLALTATAAFAGAALDAMEGPWSSRDCSRPGIWRVFRNEIEFAWPGRPVDVERVVSERGNRIETVGISPEIDGRRFTYIVSNDRDTVWIRDHRGNVDEIVRRCR